MGIPDPILKELGFENEGELSHLVASVDLTIPDQLAAFLEWKENDGSRAGLEKLVEGGGKWNDANA